MMALFWFLLMISPLVFFHELGHYVAAKRFGVKCETFAIGIGPRLASFRRGETEFSIRLFPLGGYVSMLGAAPDEQVDDADRGRALTDKPIWQRMIVYLAGPAMNVLIAVPIFWCFFMGEGLTEGPEVGRVLDGTPAAAAGFAPGDRIVSVNDREVRYFDQVQRIAGGSPGEELSFEVERDGEVVALTATPRAVRVRDSQTGLRRVTRGQLGIVWSRYPSVVHVSEGSPAWNAGLRSFDEVQSVNGEPMDAWLDLADVLANATEPVTVGVRRPERLGAAFATLAVDGFTTVTIPAGDPTRNGIHSAEAAVFDVLGGSPAAEAGIQVGDRILRAGDEPVTSLGILLQTLDAEPDEPHVLVLERAGTEMEVTVTPRTLEVTGELRSARDEVFVGLVGARVAVVPHDLVEVPVMARAWRGIGQSLVETWQYLVSIFLGLVFLVTGSVDSSNLGGPLMLADVARRAADHGLLTFARTMAVISINLGLVNLLPVPGLDGGNLVLLTAEGIKREPLSFRARTIASYVGIVCLILLMLFVFKNDIERYWAPFATWLNS